MTNNKHANFIKELPSSYKQDANYKLYKQAEAASRAIDEAVSSDWESANVDKVTVTINGKSYDVSLFAADVIGELSQFLEAVQDYAAGELHTYVNN